MSSSDNPFAKPYPRPDSPSDSMTQPVPLPPAAPTSAPQDAWGPSFHESFDSPAGATATATLPQTDWSQDGAGYAAPDPADQYAADQYAADQYAADQYAADQYAADQYAASGAPADAGNRSRARRILLGDSRRGLVLRALALVLVLVLAAAFAVWTYFDRTVTVQVDGEPQTVRFFGTEVTDALTAAGVTLDPRDEISPEISGSVDDGGTVVVRHARAFTVVTDGVESTHYTYELTVGDAITALALRLEDAELSVSRSTPLGRDGLSLEAITRKDVTLTVAGAATPMQTTARTVSALLTEAGITADADDRVTPAPDTTVTAGLAVTYAKVDVAEVTETAEVPFGKQTVEDDTLFVGETKVTQKGVPGVETITFAVTTVDGVEESRTETGRNVTTPPVDQITAKGTKPKPAPVVTPAAPESSGSGSSSGTSTTPSNVGGDVDSLNWAALAQCESGGNPSIVSSNGLYHGLYQFDRRTWQSVGGSGVASSAPASEQTYRAKLLYQQRGASPWPVCGKKLFT